MLCSVVTCYLLPRVITCCAVLLRVITCYYMMCSVVTCYQELLHVGNVVTRVIVLLNFVQQCYMF